MASATNWAKSLRVDPSSGTGHGQPGPTGIVGKFNRTNIGRNSANSPLKTSKLARAKSPDKPVKAPVVRRSSAHGSYGYNSKKQSLASKTSSATVHMEGRDEVIQVHLPLQPPKFDWRVNDENAYFELGKPADNDDQYTINITIISASYLHLLGHDQSNNRENYNWSIEYKAFECDISSDPFQLSNEDVSRRTYIGDKAKANIRASGGLFCEFLRNTSIEFRVVQMPTIDGKEKLVGIACLNLNELTKPNVNELKYILEVVSTDGDVKEIPMETRPEIRVLVQLDTEPNFFKPIENVRSVTDVQEGTEVIPDATDNLEISVTDGSGKRRRNGTKSSVTFQDDVPDSAALPPHEGQQEKSVESEEDNEAYTKDDLEEFHKFKEGETSEAMLPHLKSSLKISPSKGGGDDIRGAALSSDFESDLSPIKKPVDSKSEVAERKSPVVSPARTKSLTPSPTKRIPSLNVSLEKAYRTPEKVNQLANISFNSSESLTESLEEVHPRGPQVDIVKAGYYRVTIQLSRLWVQSREPLEHSFELSYMYPPLGIVDKYIVSIAKPDPSVVSTNERDRCSVVYDGTWVVLIVLNRLTDELLHKPLTVEIRKSKCDERRTNFLYSDIPFGSVFFEKLRGRKRVLTGQAPVLKTKGNRKVGIIEYIIKLESVEKPKLPEVSRPGFITASAMGPVLGEEEDLVQQTRITLESWKIAQQEEFKRELREKEKAYLRILSEEWTKRDQEREALLFEKVQNLEHDKRELDKQKRHIHEKEGSLKALENEVKASALKNASEQAQVLENTKFRIRQLESEHRHEVETLHRRFTDCMTEFERVKGKVLILESKLRNKDDELTAVLQSRNKWPDVEITMRLDALEKQNDSLRDQLKDAHKEIEKYKREANTLCQKLKFKQKEQDARLYDENERLRLQLFAKEQKFEMGQDRQSVQELSDKIKKLLDEKGGTYTYSKASGPPVTRHINLRAPPSPNIQNRTGKEMKRNDEKRSEKNVMKQRDSREFVEREIQRFVGERDLLLGSGVYTQYDMIVRNLENQITNLASRLSYLDDDDY